ncbi:hypothetical protein GPA22_10785 [Aromatoleum toluvorans]|uniref:Toxin CptA n=1 Tax=Aromatoleum toluvorans TaxID=92002 RepID=A0ABX1PYJ8_9RHOO|nr:protein YgfX [Aromatoleum toluvorans]NMG44213.1 hypothetical protein [Aromatoleum toluvorans]
MRYPLEIELRPSRLMHMTNAAIHAIAAFAFVRSSLPLLLVIAAVGWLMVSLRASIGAEREKAGLRLLLEEGGELRVAPPGGDRRRVVYANAAGSCADFGWAVWIHWRGARVRGARARLLNGAMMLVRDNLGQDDWRGLKIWLRHKVDAAQTRTPGDDAPARRPS